MEFTIKGVKCIFGGMKDGDGCRPLTEQEKDKIALAVAKAVTRKPNGVMVK